MYIYIYDDSARGGGRRYTPLDRATDEGMQKLLAERGCGNPTPYTLKPHPLTPKTQNKKMKTENRKPKT